MRVFRRPTRSTVLLSSVVVGLVAGVLDWCFASVAERSALQSGLSATVSALLWYGAIALLSRRGGELRSVGRDGVER